MARLTARERASLPDRAFAYVDSTGQRRLPIHDPVHVRNALARFDSVRFESDEAKDTARQRLLNAAKRHGIMPVGFITGQIRAAQRRHASLPTGTVTFLLTDIEGSTALLQRAGETYPALLDETRAVVSAAVQRAGGQTVDVHGDEVFAVFEEASAALEAAVALQRATPAHAWPGGHAVRVRAGIHTGRPTLTETGYVGLSVHTVARICSVAHGGQVVVSGRTRTAATPLPDGVRLRRLGAHRLAGLPRDEPLFQVLADGLEARFPPLRRTLSG